MSDPSERAAMIARIRARLGVSGEEPTRRASVAARIAGHWPNLIPERSRTADLVGLFGAMLKSQGADVSHVRSARDIPATVARYLRDHNLPARLRMGEEPMFADLPWREAGAVERLVGRGDGEDTAALSRAVVAAAETGTLFLVSGRDNPTTLNFLPDTHIAVIRKGDIVGPYEEAWDRLRAMFGEGAMPRTVNLISGPSRTADIEQTIIMGAHGPRRLHVIIVDA